MKKLEKRVVLSESEDGARPRGCRLWWEWWGCGGESGILQEMQASPNLMHDFQPFSNRIIGKYISMKWISWELYKLGTLWPRTTDFCGVRKNSKITPSHAIPP